MDGFSADMLTPSAVITSTCCQKSCHQDNPPGTLRTRLKIARIIRRNQQRRDITSNPQTLDRYAYVANNPVNITDPSGLYCRVGVACSTGLDPMSYDVSSAETWFDVFQGSYVNWDGSDSQMWGYVSQNEMFYVGSFSEVSGFFNFGAIPSNGAVGAWRMASRYLAIIAKSRLLSANPKCANDLAALGTSEAAIAQGATNATIQNGVGSSVPMSSLYANSPTLGRLASTVAGTVGEKIAGEAGTVAVAQLYGSNIYLNPALIDPGTASGILGDVFHEIVHNVTGLTDPDIQRDLMPPLDTGVPSANISNRLLWDCF
jgi:hypothetical protein